MSRRPIRWWNPAALVAIVALVVLVWRALKPHDTVNVADLAAVAIAAAVAAAAVVAWAKRRNTATNGPADATRAADVLAGLVERQWRDEVRHQLLDDPEPIPVRWQLTADKAVMSAPRLISTATEFTFSGRSDKIAALADAFRGLKRRRLVIAGGAGMGKTTLAVQLLLQLLATRKTDQASAREGEIVPVPVLLPVSGWDTDTHDTMQKWLADRLEQDYPALKAPQLGPGAAASLTEGGHILPVLDGLDGLDEIPAPARATVIAALNASLTDRDQLILTSRRAEFTTAIHDTGRPLTAAAVIVPKPVTPQAATDYLTACLPAVPTDVWQKVLAALRAGTASGLTKLAATPLGLWLIRTVYLAPGIDPASLIGPLGGDVDGLRAHLLDRLIPAVIQSRPPSTDRADHFRPRRRLDPDTTRRYLAYLVHMFPPATTRDIIWWRIADATAHIRHVTGLAIGLGVGLTAGPGAGLTGGLTAGLGGGLIIGLRSRSWVEETPGYASPRGLFLLLRTIKRNLVFGLGVGLAAGLAFGLLFGDHHAWVACIIAIARLAPTRRLPWRLMDFLDDAHRLGLLRAVGPVYQFRHATLHDHLAAADATDDGS